MRTNDAGHRSALTLAVLLVFIGTFGSSAGRAGDVDVAPPRLIVIVSFDQLRGDYPTSFSAYLGSRGFDRLRREGAWFPSCYFDHANLMTGPGHATLLTGCYPHRSGIPANDFCDENIGRRFYCSEDTVHGLSPMLLESPTVGDVLRARSPESKVIGIAQKDRAAILMAGHDPSAVIWMDFGRLKWATSTYYPKPSWLGELNQSVRAESHLNAVWEADNSKTDVADDVEGEGSFTSGRRTFPYQLPSVVGRDYVNDYVRHPVSVEDLFAASRFILKKGQMGQGPTTDVLCIGVSTTDFLGHTFGPDSREVREMFAACDRILAEFIDTLDAQYGRKSYLLVVTSDHGVAPVPEIIRRAAEAQNAQIDAGRIPERVLANVIDSIMNETYGRPTTRLSDVTDTTWIRSIDEPSIFLRRELLRRAGIDLGEARRHIASALQKVRGLQYVITYDNLAAGDAPENIEPTTWSYISASFHAGRTGDVVVYPRQYWIFGSNVATHGTPYDYDRHVPLYLFGWRVRPATIKKTVSPADIAPTLASWLRLTMPPMDGKVLPVTIGTAADGR